MLDDTGISPRTLTLELTETAFMQDPDRAVAVMRQIRALGRADVLEERARELGMVRPGETPYAVRGIGKPTPLHKAPTDEDCTSHRQDWGFSSAAVAGLSNAPAVPTTSIATKSCVTLSQPA